MCCHYERCALNLAVAAGVRSSTNNVHRILPPSSRITSLWKPHRIPRSCQAFRWHGPSRMILCSCVYQRDRHKQRDLAGRGGKRALVVQCDKKRLVPAKDEREQGKPKDRPACQQAPKCPRTETILQQVLDHQDPRVAHRQPPAAPRNETSTKTIRGNQSEKGTQGPIKRWNLGRKVLQRLWAQAIL